MQEETGSRNRIRALALVRAMRRWPIAILPLLSACEYPGVGGRPGGLVPADPHIAASPHFVFQTTNQGWQVYDRALTWYPGPAVLTAGCGGDARVYWDQAAFRWYMVSQIPNVTICLAVSSSWHPYLPWHQYLLGIGGPEADPADYPTLSWSDRHLLVTQKRGAGGTWVLDKATALAGSAVPFVYDFNQEELYAIRPTWVTPTRVYGFEPHTNNGGVGTGIDFVRFEGTPPGAVTVRRTTVDTQLYQTPDVIEQPAPGRPIDVRATIYDAMVHGDMLHVLVADRVGGANGSATIRWFRVRGAESGKFNLTLDSSTEVSAFLGHTYFGSIARVTTGWVIGANCSSWVPGWFVSACLAHVPANDRPAVASMVIAKLGTVAYSAGASPVRWGDYTSLAADPVNYAYVWFSAQIATDPEASNTRTWVMQVHRDCRISDRKCPAPPNGSSFSDLTTEPDDSGVILNAPESPSFESTPAESGTLDAELVVPDVPPGMVLPDPAAPPPPVDYVLEGESS